MSRTRIESLTPEQEALIPFYRQKWRPIALSSGAIDREKAADTVKAAYSLMGKQEPEILFCDSPYAALTALQTDFYDQLDSKPRNELTEQLSIQLENQLGEQLQTDLWSEFWGPLQHIPEREQLEHQLDSQLDRQLANSFFVHQCIKPVLAIFECSWIDFCISVLDCDYNTSQWNVLQSIMSNCERIVPLEKVCLICDRPIKLSFDSEYRLHAEGEPAILFADGYSLYSYHGITLPEKYGSVHPRQWQAQWYLEENDSRLRKLLIEVLPPQQWQSQWLLEESDAEVLRVLIQGIGYARVCQELQATELDSWQEYTLLRIDNTDVEPINLLTRTSPSTGQIHVLRVPPDIQSAYEANLLVIWDIDPEEFSAST